MADSAQHQPAKLPLSGGVWPQLRIEAMQAVAEEPLLASYLHATILHHDKIEEALAYHLAQKLGGGDMSPLQLREVCREAFNADPEMVRSAERDMRAVRERDPACKTYLQPFLFFKGYAGLQAYRVSHWLWTQEREILAYYLQSRISELFSVDIHPNAEIGAGVFIDHAHGIVIGETAVVEDDVSMLHSVTLGGTGKETGDRHPKIRRGVLIGAGAKVLGNIEVGEDARIAAGSVVLQDVGARCTVAGVPAKPVGGPCCEGPPAEEMNQVFDPGI
ncbi:MAG TPA: serine O-acetyltransferase [Caulobacterales bacterium]|jgi:serine O-acetyltransferase|nr:serine O-acetyltransferase [Caulobacterales bacterium]